MLDSDIKLLPFLSLILVIYQLIKLIWCEIPEGYKIQVPIKIYQYMKIYGRISLKLKTRKKSFIALELELIHYYFV